MPRFPIPSLKARKMQEEQREQTIQHALVSRNKALESSKRDKKQKKNRSVNCSV